MGAGKTIAVATLATVLTLVIISALSASAPFGSSSAAVTAEVTGPGGFPVQVYGSSGGPVETTLNASSTAALNAGRTCFSETTWRHDIDGGVNCVPMYPDGGCVINTSRTRVLIRNRETTGTKMISCGQSLQDLPNCSTDGPGFLLSPGEAFEFTVHDIDQLVCRNCGVTTAAVDATGLLCL